MVNPVYAFKAMVYTWHNQSEDTFMFKNILLVFIILFSFSVNAEIKGVGASTSFTGLSTDTKPTTVEAGSFFYETDTQVAYEYYGSVWNHIVSKDWLDVIRSGGVEGFSIVQKFGHSDNVGTSYVPVSQGEVYQTPTSVATLEFVSSSTVDAQDDVGAREITITGLDASWNEQTVVVSTHATDGLTAVAITGNWYRVYRVYISSSGTYASPTSGSHAGTITIRESGAGATWAEITLNGAAYGQSLIAAYTIKAGYTAYVGNVYIGVNTGKVVDMLVMQRSDANDITSPYDGVRRAYSVLAGIDAPTAMWINSWRGPFDEYTDLGFLAKVSTGTASISVDFEILLIKNP